jgi:hypothetical protein
MAKKKSKPVAEVYQYVTATVMDGEVTWRYQLLGKPPGNMRHDEDVSGWSKEDIVNLTMRMLDVPSEDKAKISVQFLDD